MRRSEDNCIVLYFNILMYEYLFIPTKILLCKIKYIKKRKPFPAQTYDLIDKLLEGLFKFSAER